MDKEEIIKGCKSGDKEAQAALYKAYYTRMLRLCVRITGDMEAAKDVLHDGFIIIFSEIGNLRSARSLDVWISRIMTNLALRHVGNGNMQKRIGPDEIADIAADEQNDVLMISYDELMRMVDSLPDGYREVFRLSELDGLTHKEIAGLLGIEPRSSSSQLARAKQKLREMLRQYRAHLTVLLALLVSSAIVILQYMKDIRQPEPVMGNAADSKRDTDGSRTAESDDGNRRKTSVAAPEYRHTYTSALTVAQPVKTDTLSTLIADSMPTVTPDKTDSVILMPVQPADTLLFIADTDMAADTAVITSGRDKWMFSLNTMAGQASVSMLPRVFSLVSNVIESGTRVEIKTWQQLTHYLTYEVGDGMNPAERDVLLRIASIYDGKIMTRKDFERPLQLGVNFSKRLNDRLNLDFGLRLTRHTTNLQTGEADTTNISERQRTYFIGVPVNATYSLASKGRWTLYGTAGLALDVPFYGTSKVDYNIDNKVVYRRHGRLTLPRWQWSTNIGVGIGYDIAPNLQLYVNPRFTWYIPNGSRTQTQWNDKPFQFSLPFGLRFIIK